MISSEGRVAALGKFLVSYAESLGKITAAKQARSAENAGPSNRTKQLHILYLLSDLIHHTRHHSHVSPLSVSTAELLKQPVSNIVTLASKYDQSAHARHHTRIKDLIEIWETRGDYPIEHCQKLRDHAATALRNAPINSDEVSKSQARDLPESTEIGGDVPFNMPATHGEESTPFYDLPAGNMMPHIIPNSTAPIDPQSMKPLHFPSGPADKILISAVQDLLRSADELDSIRLIDWEGEGRYINEMGQVLTKDDGRNDVLEGESYYGWSYEFCQDMKRMASGSDKYRGITNRELSYEGSQSPRKRRRYSYSSSNRSRSRDGFESRSRSRNRSRNRSRSRDRDERPGAAHNGFRESQVLTPTTSKSYHSSSVDPRVNPDLQGMISVSGTVVPPPHTFTQGHPLGPGGLVIPPRPPNYVGLWPPPPPPPPGPGGALPFSVPGMGVVFPSSAQERLPAAYPRGQNRLAQGPFINTNGGNRR